MRRSILAGYGFFTGAGLIVAAAICFGSAAVGNRAIKPVIHPPEPSAQSRQTEIATPAQRIKKNSPAKQGQSHSRPRSRAAFRGAFA